VFCTAEPDSQDSKVSVRRSDAVSVETDPSHMQQQQQQPVADDCCVAGVHEVMDDIKDEVSDAAADADSDTTSSNTSTSQTRTQLSKCIDDDVLPADDCFRESNVEPAGVKLHLPVDDNRSQPSKNQRVLSADNRNPRTDVDDGKAHKSKRRLVTCPVCSKNLQFASLSIHMRRHSSYRPFCCTVCSREFTRNHDLTEHMNIHSGECSFTCKVCNMQFRHRRSLSRHTQMHTR